MWKNSYMVVNLCGIIFLGLEKLVADLVWKWVAWTLVHWISQLSKLLVQQENITLEWTTWQDFFMPYVFSYLVIRGLFIYCSSTCSPSIRWFFLSCLAFIIFDVICVACHSRSLFVLHTPEYIKQTNYATDQRCQRLPKQLQPCKREASAHRALSSKIYLNFY